MGYKKQKPNCSAFACPQEDAALFRGLKTCERCPRRRLPLPRTEEMAASVQDATAPEDELVAAASQLRLDDVKVARSFCKVFAARARAAEAHGARAKAFGDWRRCTERAAPAAPASTTPRKRRRTPLKALENIQPTSGGKPRSARSPRSPQPASNGKSG